MGVIGKVISAPFRAIGSLFGGGDSYTPQTVTTEPEAQTVAAQNVNGDTNKKSKSDVKNTKGVRYTKVANDRGVVSSLLNQPVSGVSDTVSNLGGGKR